MASLEHSDGFQYYLARDGNLDTLPELKDGDRLFLQERSCRIKTADGLCLEKFKSTGALANHIKLDHVGFNRAAAEKTGNPTKERRNRAREFYAEQKKLHLEKHPEQALPATQLVQNLMTTPSQPVQEQNPETGLLLFPMYKRSNKKQGIVKGQPNWNEAEKIIKAKKLGSVPCDGCEQRVEDGHCVWDQDKGCQSFTFFEELPPQEVADDEV